ncbi:MAG: 3-oxoacyl-[acyl-carrier protein] reductase [Eubacteriales bacterium]|nr:3-oxoacyl-[acyl-carrier protein] reductase [Eubacteriales bacterium]
MFLEEKTAIVTGASRGIGKAIAVALAREGATVVINDLSQEAAEAAAAEIRANNGRAIAMAADVADSAQVETMVTRVMEECGRIDILVNNAGITRDTLLLRMKEEDWDAVLNVNLKGVFNCTKAVSRFMIKQRSGVIVNIASVVAVMGNIGQANYAAAKAGILGFTKAVARELASRGIRVNAVAPGYIQTDMTEKIPEEIKAKLIESIPLGFIGQPEDVAEAVLFLVSPAARYITGQTLHVNGGMVMV